MASKRKANPSDNVPIVEKLYRERQPSFTDAGGFDADDDRYEERRERITESVNLRRNRAYLGIQPPENCQDCDGSLGSAELWNRFNYPVCNECRDQEGRHKVIHKTEAKTRFLLRDEDLDLRKPPLRFISKKNPHNPRYGDMKLYLLPQLEARAIEVHGSLEALEEAREAKNVRREVTREKQFEKKIKAMRHEMRAANNKMDVGVKTHVHDFADPVVDEESGMHTKKCRTCEVVVSFELM